MTDEDILRMAREADPFDEDGRLYAIAALTPKTLARFAALVADAEREEIKAGIAAQEANFRYIAAAAELRRLHERVQELEASEAAEVCYEAYQVVGILLNELGLLETEQATKILDNLSQARKVHDDVLPWTFECPWESRQLGASEEHAAIAHKDGASTLAEILNKPPEGA